jgi:hypothetical protein
MRAWLYALAGVCALLLACGGGTSPSVTVTPQADSGQSVLPRCDSPLPAGQIAFQGIVTEVHAGPYQSDISVSLERISAQPGSAIHGAEQDWVHSVLTIAWGPAPTLSIGDCVLGSGSVRHYSTHPPSDQVAFVPDELVKASDVMTPAPSPVQSSADQQGVAPRTTVWFVGQVFAVMSLDSGTDFGRRDVTVTVEDVALSKSTASPSSKTTNALKLILQDSAGWPGIKQGDMLEVVGSAQAFACGAACDRYGFVPTFVRVID